MLVCSFIDLMVILNIDADRIHSLSTAAAHLDIAETTPVDLMYIWGMDFSSPP